MQAQSFYDRILADGIATHQYDDRDDPNIKYVKSTKNKFEHPIDFTDDYDDEQVATLLNAFGAYDQLRKYLPGTGTNG